jgi:hypothetical protein
MYAERLALCNGKRIHTWKVEMQRHVQERVLLVVNLVDCLLREVQSRFRLPSGREILNLLSDLYILSPHQGITMTMWFHHTILKPYEIKTKNHVL